MNLSALTRLVTVSYVCNNTFCGHNNIVYIFILRMQHPKKQNFQFLHPAQKSIITVFRGEQMCVVVSGENMQPSSMTQSTHSCFFQSLLTGCGEDLFANIRCRATTLPPHLQVLYLTAASVKGKGNFAVSRFFLCS